LKIEIMKIYETKPIAHFTLALLSSFMAACTGVNNAGSLNNTSSVSTATVMAANSSRPTTTLEFTPTVTAFPTLEPTPTPLPPPFFDTFVATLMNGDASQVVGVFVENIMALRVVQQPPSNPAFVSPVAETATYFTMVQEYTGNTGLLAHNYLAGIYYFDLQPGQVVVLVYGDGRTEEYVVSQKDEFQALNPTSPTSSFVDLETGVTFSSTDMFHRVYGGDARTTLQTCISEGSIDSWGRLFVIALQE
jgi:hypothetical protein